MMVEFGDSVARVDELLLEAQDFHQKCVVCILMEVFLFSLG